MYTWPLKGLSRVKLKFHARFLWGWRVVTPSGYQAYGLILKINASLDRYDALVNKYRFLMPINFNSINQD